MWWEKALRPFFRITQGYEVVEGTKLRNGFLHLIIKFGNEAISIKCSPENVTKLRDWLTEQYPRENNVRRLFRSLSISQEAADPKKK